MSESKKDSTGEDLSAYCYPLRWFSGGWFSGKPTRHGWYFLAHKKEDWDIAEPVEVRRIENGNGEIYCEVYLNKEWKRVDSPGFMNNALWVGPIPYPAKPTIARG